MTGSPLETADFIWMSARSAGIPNTGLPVPVMLRGIALMHPWSTSCSCPKQGLWNKEKLGFLIAMLQEMLWTDLQTSGGAKVCPGKISSWKKDISRQIQRHGHPPTAVHPLLTLHMCDYNKKCKQTPIPQMISNLKWINQQQVYKTQKCFVIIFWRTTWDLSAVSQEQEGAVKFPLYLL